MEANHTEPRSDPKSTKNRGLDRNLAMTQYGQSGAIRSLVSDPAPVRRTPNISLCRHNVRTLADTARETDRGLQQMIAGCEEYNIDIIAIQEHRLTSNNPINYQRLGD